MKNETSSRLKLAGFKAGILVMVLSCLLTACRSGKVSGQPPLHIPETWNSRKFNEVNFQSLTNGGREAIGTAETNSLDDFRVHAKSRSHAETNVVAYMQIMTDEDAREEFGVHFAKYFYIAEVIVENRSNAPFLAYGASMNVNVAYYVSEDDWKKKNVRRLMEKRFNNEYILSSRRPAVYSDILAIFEFERRSNWKQQTVDHLRSAGEIAAAATVFVGGPTYPKAVAFATGVVTTEIEKRLLWDILLHSKNLEARSFKELEEVPARSSIHRLVFFPKRGIPGVLDGHLVYISSFSDQSRTTREPVYISGSFINKIESAATAER